MKTNRRNFIKTSALAGMAGSFGFLPLEALAGQRKWVSPNEKVQIGVIGCNGMGWANMRAHFEMNEVECVAIADVDQSVREKRAGEAEAFQGKRPKLYKDYRELLNDKDVDAVIIGAPDHWHCLMLVNALDAAKHVYVEKPLANSIKECQVMVDAFQKYKRVVQVGQWQRSGTHYDQAVAMVRSGDLGKIRLVKVWAYQGWMNPIPKRPNGTPPAGVDYDMWLGPAPKRPFNPNRFHFNFRWFWDYAGGLMTDWGVHEIDIALFAMQATAPKSVTASGGKFAYPDDASETPDTLQTVFEYDDFNMLWEHATGIDGGNYGKTEGIAFIGNNATLVVNRQGWELHPETERKDGIVRYKIEDIPDQVRPSSANYLSAHARNFVEALKANNPKILKCGIETGSVAAINAHMGNIAFKTGRKVYWDQATQSFKDDAEANSMITPEYHNGWDLP